LTKHQVLVYGTLRPFTNANIVRVPGHLYDLGSFPGVKLDNSSETMVTCEAIEVTDEELERLDMYEGYRPSDPDNSLYIRRKLDWGPFIYEYNGCVRDTDAIPSGDWSDVSTRSVLEHFILPAEAGFAEEV
jgi:gamma-glutamylcyclotransferase (GGCT)/AIG2-like uncharacterized protein YtfP